jgi:ParB family chromosome partitioning protein
MPSTALHSAQYQSIPLGRIDLQNDDFRITTRKDDDDLLTSIRQIGLITPPVLISRGSFYAVVSGFRRLTVCRKLGWSEIMARVLGPETEHFDCTRIAIAENALHRPLNLIETSRALHKLSLSLHNKDQLSKAAASCGLPASHSITDKIKALCLMPAAFQNAILSETISLAMANELARMDRDDIVIFVGLFEKLKLSLGKQREIVTLISEIARREDLSARQVLAHEKIQLILNNEDLDRGHMGREMRTFLRQWRYPRIVKAEQNYHFHLKKLKLGQNIKLIPPREFEGTTYTLALTFSSLAHLRTLQSEVDKAMKNPSLTEIVKGEISKPE